jgi:predicted dehydrogenase
MRRVGIVGVGGIGLWHLSRWQQLPVEIAGCFDVSPEAAERAAHACGARAFGSLAELLAAVDIADVCTPTSCHREPVLAAAAAGKDVVCEKPLARTLADAQAMVDACSRAGVRLFVAQVVRFFPQFARAREIVASGAIGRPGVLRSLRGGSPPATAGRGWFADFQQSGGVIMDLGVHDIDFARWCLGDVERVFAQGLAGEDVQPQDHALIVLRHKSGAVSHIEVSWAYPPGSFTTALEIACEHGLLEYDSAAPAPLTLTLTPDQGPQSAAVPQHYSPLAPRDDPYLLELEHFLSCLESGAEFRVTPEDGLEAVRVALAAIESRRTGLPVPMSTFGHG